MTYHFLLATLLLSVLAFAAFLLLDVIDATMTATTTVATCSNGSSTSSSDATDGGAAIDSPPRRWGSEGGNDLLVYIGYLSAPDNRIKRDSLRELCFPKIRMMKP